jgi:hypothetical protein
MSGHRDKSKPSPEIKVFIRDAHGKYLAQDDNGLFFSQDRTSALVLSYQGDDVPGQLEAIRKAQGIELIADPVPLDEIYEICDQCGEFFVPFMTYFDGQRFLCVDCRRLGSPKPASRARRST